MRFCYFGTGMAVSIIIALVLPTMSACRKQPTAAELEKKKAEQFHTTLQQSLKFRLTAYYSDKPIDYIESDSVQLLETDLWKYVRDYVKDDYYLFTSAGDVEVIQNALKIPSDFSDTIRYNYNVNAEGDHTDFNFYDYEYNPLTYKLAEFSADYFIVYVTRGDANIYSRYEKVP